MGLKHPWLPRVQDSRQSFLYDDGFCSFTFTKDTDLTIVIILSLCIWGSINSFQSLLWKMQDHTVLPFFYKAICFFLSPMAFYYPFSWPHQEKMMWQNSHSWMCCGKDLNLTWWWRAQPLNWRPTSEEVLAQGFALTSLEPCSLSEFDPVFLARKSNNEQKSSGYETAQLLQSLRTPFVTHCSCNKKKKIVIFD